MSLPDSKQPKPAWWRRLLPHREPEPAGPPPGAAERRRRILQAPITATLVRLSLPMVVSNQLDHVMTLILMFWIGQLAGAPGLDVFFITTPVLTVMGFLATQSIGTGLETLISTSVGAEDNRGVRILRSGVQLAVVTAACIAVVGGILAYPIAGWLTNDQATTHFTGQFLIGMFVLALPIQLIAEPLLIAIMSSGWTSFALFRILLDLVILMALTPLFMQVLGFGMLGPPVAEAIAGVILLALLWRVIHRHRGSLGLGTEVLPYREIDRSSWREIFSIGLPPQLGRVTMWAIQIFMFQLLVRESDEAVGGYGLSRQLFMLVSAVSGAFAQGTAVMVGQNKGAGQPQRALGAVASAALVVGGIGVAFIAIAPFTRPVFGLFTDDPVMVESAVGILSILKWAWLGAAAFQILMAAYAATGATKLASTVIIVSELLGLGFALVYPGSASEKVAYAFCFAAAVRTVLLLALIRHALIRPLMEAKVARERETTSLGDAHG